MENNMFEPPCGKTGSRGSSNLSVVPSGSVLSSLVHQVAIDLFLLSRPGWGVQQSNGSREVLPTSTEAGSDSHNPNLSHHREKGNNDHRSRFRGNFLPLSSAVRVPPSVIVINNSSNITGVGCRVCRWLWAHFMPSLSVSLG